MSRPDRELSWVADGQALFEQTVMRLDDLREPSRLPGWTRGHVVTHVARNAEGLCRLLRWARTGIETPMYPSIQARDAAIEAGAGRREEPSSSMTSAAPEPRSRRARRNCRRISGTRPSPPGMGRCPPPGFRGRGCANSGCTWWIWTPVWRST